jgi:predicted small metal-binding protein
MEKTMLPCPCGEHIEGENEDDLVKRVYDHLRQAHPGLEYTREQILELAY